MDERLSSLWKTISSLFARGDDELESLARDLTGGPADTHIAKLQSSEATDEDFVATRRALQAQLTVVAEMERVVRTRLEMLQRLHARHKYVVRFDDDHWPERRDRIERDLERDPAGGTRTWLKAYVEALAKWELDECGRLATIDLPVEGGLPDTLDVTTATAGLRDADYEAAEPLLLYLADRAEIDGRATISRANAGMTESLLGRLGLKQSEPRIAALRRSREELKRNRDRQASSDDDAERRLLTAEAEALQDEIERLRAVVEPDLAEVGRHFDRAARLDENSVLPLAGEAALARFVGDDDDAIAAAEDAIDSFPDAPDGHIEAGIWARANGQHDRAWSYFGRAAALLAEFPSPVRATETELRPHPPELWLELARRLHADGLHGEALTAVARSQTGRLEGGDNPNAERYELEVEIREHIDGSDVDLAAAFRSAGKERYWGDDVSTAVGHLRRAIELDPDESSQYFFLADAHLRLSYESDAPHGVDTEELARAGEAWDQGRQRTEWSRQPSEAWAFITRALVAQQQGEVDTPRREELWWQAIVSLERGLHHRPEMASAWALLGRYLRYKRFVWGAETATRRARQLSPEDPTVLEERVLIKLELCELDSAAEVLATRRRRSPDDAAWHDFVEGFVHLFGGDPSRAAGYFRGAAERDPSRRDYAANVARCSLILGDSKRGVEGFRRLLSSIGDRSDDDIPQRDLTVYLTAAIHVGDDDLAERLYRRAASRHILEPFEKHYYAASIAVVRGDIDGADARFTSAVHEAKSPADLALLGHVTLPALRTAGVGWPGAEETSALFDRLTTTIARQRSELGPSDAGYPHLLTAHESALETRADPAVTVEAAAEAEWQLTGTAVVLGRLYRIDGDLDRAIHWYRTVEHSPHYPEATDAIADLVEERLDAAYGLFDGRAPTAAAIEVSSDLIPMVSQDEEGLTDDFQQRIAAMRDRIREEHGITVPGIRVRGNDGDMAPGTYVVSLWDLPTARGDVDRFGRPVPDGDGAESSVAAQLISRLEEALVDGLERLVGVQTMIELVGSVDSERSPEVAEDARALARLTALARQLLADGLPVVDVPALLDVVLSRRDDGVETWENLAAVRAAPELRRRLPGNDGAGWELHPLGRQLEEGILTAVEQSRVGGDTVKDLDASFIGRVLGAVAGMAERGGRRAVVVRSAEARPAVRDIVRAGFPDIRVVTRDEVDDTAVLSAEIGGAR